jgi:hypothetical protein
MNEPPAIFGFHANANITKELFESHQLCGNLLELGEIEGTKKKMDVAAPTIVQNAEKPILQESKESSSAKYIKQILAELPAPFDTVAIYEQYPFDRNNSFNTVLVQECG